VQVNGSRTVKYGALAKALTGFNNWKLVYRNIDSPHFWVRGPARKLFYRRVIMPRIDGIIGVSRRTLIEALELYGIRAPSQFIPNGVDLDKLRPLMGRHVVRIQTATPEDSRVLLFVGQMGNQKRPDRFVELIRRLRDAVPPVVGWMIGEGPERERAEQLAWSKGVQERLRFLGHQTDVASYLAAGDVLVLTSDTEGIPAVVIEAGYLGKPTVAFDVGGMRECIDDGVTGKLVPAADEEALAEGVVWLLTDERASQLGAQAKCRVEREFSMEAVGRSYIDFFRQLVEPPPEGGGWG
jgi:glycosyltransferase involved in cell wall biosynthesis